MQQAYSSGSGAERRVCCAERFWTLIDSVSSRVRPTSQQALAQEQGDIQLVEFESKSTGQQDHLELPHSKPCAAS